MYIINSTGVVQNVSPPFWRGIKMQSVSEVLLNPFNYIEESLISSVVSAKNQIEQTGQVALMNSYLSAVAGVNVTVTDGYLTHPPFDIVVNAPTGLPIDIYERLLAAAQQVKLAGKSVAVAWGTNVIPTPPPVEPPPPPPPPPPSCQLTVTLSTYVESDEYFLRVAITDSAPSLYYFTFIKLSNTQVMFEETVETGVNVFNITNYIGDYQAVTVKVTDPTCQNSQTITLDGGASGGGGGGTQGLTPTGRVNFTPSTQRGNINFGAFPEFTLPPQKVLIWMGAGRNHARAVGVGKDVFNWGFTHIDQSRLYWFSEYNTQGAASPIPISKRCKNIMGAGLSQNPDVDIPWADNYNFWADVWFENSPAASQNPPKPNYWRNLGIMMRSEGGFGEYYGDAPGAGFPYDIILIDIENIGDGTETFAQEHANLWVHLTKELKGTAGSKLVGTLEPVAFNCFNDPKLDDYNPAAAPNVWLWDRQAQLTTHGNNRNMPSALAGSRVTDWLDINMAGNYYSYVELLPSGTYSDINTGASLTVTHVDGPSYSRKNWLTNLLGNQEVNIARSGKPRVAWVWLFNQDNIFEIKKRYPHNNGIVEWANNFPDTPLPPAIAEGTAIFGYMTGLKGMVVWDNWGVATPGNNGDLAAGNNVPIINSNGTPNADPTNNPPNYNLYYYGQGDQRFYTGYEHFIHGLWRLFGNHSDMFNANTIYLNQNTKCSYDNGATWHQYNAVQLRDLNLPVVRAIVNGNQILVAATKPYAGSGIHSV